MADGGNTIETLLRVLGTGLSAGRGFGSEPWGAGLLALSQTMADKRQREEQAKLAETLFQMLPDDVQEQLGDIGVDAPGMGEVLKKIVPGYYEQPTVNLSLTGQDITPESLTGLAQAGLGGGGLIGAEFQDRPLPLSQREKDLLRLTAPPEEQGGGLSTEEAVRRVFPLASEKPPTAGIKKLEIQEKEKKAARIEEGTIKVVNQAFIDGVIPREKLDEIVKLMDEAFLQVQDGKMTHDSYNKFLEKIRKRISEQINIEKRQQITKPPISKSKIWNYIPDFVEQYIPGTDPYKDRYRKKKIEENRN